VPRAQPEVAPRVERLDLPEPGPAQVGEDLAGIVEHKRMALVAALPDAAVRTRRGSAA